MSNTAFPMKSTCVLGCLITSLCAQAQTEESIPKAEELVVTGQKVERSLQDTPASVAVLTEGFMEDQQIDSFYGLLDRVPNVHGTLGSGFSIRGIDAFNVSGGGNSYLASVYVDGAPLPYRAIQKSGFLTWDVSQVEVLRGPQSTLQGRNSLAGAIVVNTQDPTYEWEGKLRLGAGEYGKQQLAFAGGGALIDDVLAFRVSAEQYDFDGINDNITRGDHPDFNNNNTYRGKLLFEPTEDLSALLSFTRTETEYGVRWTEPNPEQGGSDFDHRIVTFNDPTFEKNDADITTLNLDYRINDNLELMSITSYSDSQYGYEWDGDATAEPLSVLIDDRVDETLSQEFRLVMEFERLSGVVGAYYSDLDVVDEANGQRSLTIQQTGLPTLLVTPPEYGGIGLDQATADTVLSLYAPIDPVRLGTYSKLEQGVETQAVFTDLTFRLTDNWDIFGGLRWDKEEQRNASDTLYTIDNEDLLPNPADYAANPQFAMLITGINAQLYQMVDDASGTEPPSDASFDEWLPKLGTTYRFTDDVSLSFTYQEGYRSGGVGTNVARGSIFTYQPEFTDNYELALRTAWLDGALTANANVFFIDWQDQQIAVQLSGNSYDTETQNAGSSTVEGFELELNYAVTEALQVFGGLGYSHTEFDEFTIVQPTATYDLAGRAFPRAPEWTANIGASYRAASGLFASVNANYADSSIVAVNPYANGLTEGDPGFDPQNDARTLVNAKLGYEWDQVALYATVTNLLDEEYVELANVGTPPSVTLGAPRQWGVSLDYRF
ncbi:TonB-dependent receptor [Gilvimarinus xylanilyticus]|uniref:TonB-dependent receptor n=1 Tax=Gilvimarinus xylanilyticus TaxID=2944139 RepID=A0A9X2I1A6_9GAMM|nr:TonB-dependent receptor [Gilvimarinus xylanilyticus]MCP8898505.1 TonB-dependent receptor [Gilvimarinus xylanilyticus]